MKIKYFAIDFNDEWGFAIRGNAMPTKENLIEFEGKKYGYSVKDIKDTYEISREEAIEFYDGNIDEWPMWIDGNCRIAAV